MRNLHYSNDNGLNALINSNGFKYIAYDMKTPEGKEFEDEFSNNNGLEKYKKLNIGPLIKNFEESSKISAEGICSDSRIPSLGEWQDLLSFSSLFLYYGSDPLLNLISPGEFLELIHCYEGQAVVIFDRINPLKKIVRKYSPIHANHENTPIIELPKLHMSIMTLLGASVILTNTFSIDPIVNVNFLERI